MKDTIIIDMDGTLANVEHRRHLVSGEKKDFKSFHESMVMDPINEWCQILIQNFWTTGFDVILVSARPQEYEHVTKKWLEKHQVQYTALFLVRPKGEHAPDQELKRAWLKKFGKEHILFVVDDRQKVVDMWREEELVCLQCDAWEEKSGD